MYDKNTYYSKIFHLNKTQYIVQESSADHLVTLLNTLKVSLRKTFYIFLLFFTEFVMSEDFTRFIH